LRTVRGPAGGVVEVICIDSGPGMPDVGLSLKDGHSTSGTLGIGLGAVFRLADDCDVYSETGRGTVMVNRFHERADTPRQDWPSGGLTRPLGGETACGDIFAVHEDGPITFGMVCDGLGHGPLAAIAAQEAVRILRAGPPPVSPSEVLERLHRGLSHTRGGAISVVRIDRETRQIRFAGLGNVSGWIVRPDGRQGMISVPGIAGHQARTFREYGYELPPGAAVVLHSDGLTDRWDLTGYRGLLAQPALVIAATLLRDKGVRRDDGGVLVIKPS
ncbi:MAG: SpoIIE family protein phosphatase, partial [Streptosporangiaceae bacterium]